MKREFRATIGSEKLEKESGTFKIFRDIEILNDDGEWEHFRDHCWVSYGWSSSKKLDNLKIHERISFTANLYEYIDSQLNKKKCFKKIRNINHLG